MRLDDDTRRFLVVTLFYITINNYNWLLQLHVLEV